MQTRNGQPVSDEESPHQTASGTRNVSAISIFLTPAQAEFMDFVLFHGVLDLAHSLRLIHDVALYHSDIPIDEKEKTSLFNLKLLWEGFEKMHAEA